MKKFEYKFIECRNPNMEDFNKEGKKGWEFVAETERRIARSREGGRVILCRILFKREIHEQSKKS